MRFLTIAGTVLLGYAAVAATAIEIKDRCNLRRAQKKASKK